MLHSTDRILTTHVGSLPRNETLSRLLIDQEAGKAVDKAALSREAEAATAHVIAAQVKAGIDVGNDGEQSRVAFQTYVPRCMCGFGGESKRPPSRDQEMFPSWTQQLTTSFPYSARMMNPPAAISEVSTSTARRSARMPPA